MDDMTSEALSERRMLERKVDDGANAPIIPRRRLSPSQYVSDETEDKFRSIEEGQDDDSFYSSFSVRYPGAVAVLPGLNEARAHLESLKAAENDLNDSTHHHVGDGYGHMNTSNIVSASVVPVAAIIAEDDDSPPEPSEELALLRKLVSNAVPAEHVSISHDENKQNEGEMTSVKKQVTIQKVPKVQISKEGLQDGQSTDQQSRITESSNAGRNITAEIKIKKKKKTCKELCCGSHAVILDSVILTEDT